METMFLQKAERVERNVYHALWSKIWGN